MRFLFYLFFTFIATYSIAQTNTQNIYGQVRDAESGEKLFGASVVLLNQDPIIGTTADMNGNYELKNIPIGRLHIQISYIGYETQTSYDVLLSSGKTMNLDVQLVEKFNSLNEITISAKTTDNSTLNVTNEMATVSAMSFNLEQSTRYAGSLNDPSRLVLSLPGVRNQGDVQNGISVRGNTPSGLLWCLEGMEIQSPNHFARDGAQGAVNMINSNILQGVDFYTAAFPAEYGNAGSGVFDLKMRKGNPDEFEFSMAAGTLGLEASAEGPLSKKSKASFLFSYRYSTLGLLYAIGYNVGGNSAPAFQDFNFKLNFPTKKAGTFQVFGLVGDSRITPVNKTVEGDWKDQYRLSIIGLKNTKRVSDKTLLNSSLLYSQSKGQFTNNFQNSLYNQNKPGAPYTGERIFKESFPIIEKRLQLDLKTSTKVNAKHSFQTGLNMTSINFFQEFKRSRDTYRYDDNLQELVFRQNRTDSSVAEINTLQIKVFMQHKIRVTERMNFTAGLHFIHLNANQFYSAEPRIGMDLKYGKGHLFSAGAGLHSRLEPLGFYHVESTYYEVVENNPDFGPIFKDDFGKPNENLQASRSIHFVMGNKVKLAKNLIFKTEIYLQYLYQVPVLDYDYDGVAFISSNFQYPSIYDYNFNYQDVFVNKGKGMNYGIDLSLEKSFANNYYILINGSLYQSKYKTPTSEELYEVKWLNTRYNGNFIFTTTIGKDFILGKNKNNSIGLNFRSILAGNNRILFPEEGSFIRPFESRLNNYFRIDTRVSYTRNKEKYAWTLSLDLQNTTNRINEASNPLVNATGIIPFLNYKVDFGFLRKKDEHVNP